MSLVKVLGDSLTDYAEQDNRWPEEWVTNAKFGRPLFRAQSLLTSMVTVNTPTIMILAVGSNDVNLRQTRAQMNRNIAQAKRTCLNAGVDYIFMTTVKVNGVSGYYAHGEWVKYAQNWNSLVRNSGLRVIDWGTHCRGHPNWFIEDGLHMTNTGEQAYVDYIETKVGNFT
jgi:lysophospholipase L1-like esterase